VKGCPVEITPPDLRPYRRGVDGIPHVVARTAALPGPHAMIVALVHGNELSGALALEQLIGQGVEPSCGRLSLVFANVDAFARFDPAEPRATRFLDEDLNRLWDPSTLDGPRHSRELERARALRPLIESADLLLDLHSMQHPGPPLLLAGTAAKGLELARRMGFPAHVVVDRGHADGTRMRDHGAFADPARPQTALLLEAGQHWARRSVEVAFAACLHFLRAAGMIAPAHARALLPPHAAPPQRVIEVTEVITADGGGFAFAADYRGLEVIPTAGTVIAHRGDRPVRTPYDDCVLVMPSLRLVPGLTAVRLGRFVDAHG
jgi:predicted deacylase